MLSFLYVYSDHSILECYNLFSGVELSMRSFFVIRNKQISYKLHYYFSPVSISFLYFLSGSARTKGNMNGTGTCFELK